MDTEKLSQVLHYINAVRTHCGMDQLLELPKGAAPDTAGELSRMCPLARAIPQTVIGADYIRTSDRQTAEALSRSFAKPLHGMIEFPGEFAIDLPDALLTFINQYDEGQLPQFIEAM